MFHRTVVLLLGACLTPLCGQVDSFDLRARYGPPVEVVFAMRPAIEVTAHLADGRKVCTLTIYVTGKKGVATAELTGELVDELLPLFVRGLKKQEGTVCAGNCMKISIFENVSIEQNEKDVTLSGDKRWLAGIRFRSCDPPG